MLEKNVEQYLSKKVKEARGLSLKWISTVSGVPDRLVFLNGQILLVELKTRAGVLSPRQRLMFDKLSKLGHNVFVLRSKEEIDEFINTITEVPGDETRPPNDLLDERKKTSKNKEHTD